MWTVNVRSTAAEFGGESALKANQNCKNGSGIAKTRSSSGALFDAMNKSHLGPCARVNSAL